MRRRPWGWTRQSSSDHPDGALVGVDQGALAAEVSAAIGRSHAVGLVVFDPSGVTGHPDHVAASAAALRAAAMADLPVLGWTLPREVAERLNDEFGTGFVGHQPPQIDLTVTVDRDRQRMASLAHASQAVPTSVLWRRLELLGDIENLRWLRTRDTPASAVSVASPPSAGDATAFTSGSVPPAAGGSPEAATLRVVYVSGDRFEVSIREHVVTVDQPVQAGGQDIGPTPTELFVAGLASCVAFYARRYLRRHKLDATGLTVQTSYRMGTKPARVTQVDMQIQVPADLPPARRDGLLAVASHCTVHNSITTAPQITIAAGGRAARGPPVTGPRMDAVVDRSGGCGLAAGRPAAGRTSAGARSRRTPAPRRHRRAAVWPPPAAPHPPAGIPPELTPVRCAGAAGSASSRRGGS